MSASASPRRDRSDRSDDSVCHRHPHPSTDHQPLPLWRPLRSLYAAVTRRAELKPSSCCECRLPRAAALDACCLGTAAIALHCDCDDSLASSQLPCPAYHPGPFNVLYPTKSIRPPGPLSARGGWPPSEISLQEADTAPVWHVMAN